MRGRHVILILAALLPGSMLAGRAARAAGCLAAAAAAERQYGIPSGLLAAIGEVESGRLDPASGRVVPWPYTIDTNGNGRYFADAAAAARALAALGPGPPGMVDVGCFQIDLAFHPDAFENSAEAFAPETNARYAARLLAGLRAQSGSWGAAVAAYHSATPALGKAYRDRVLALWQGVMPPVQRFGITVWTPQSLAGSMASAESLRDNLPHIIVPTLPATRG